MDTRRSFLKKASLLSGSIGLMQVLPPSIQRALAIDPEPGSTWQDAEHIVFLMQENRSFDHTFGTLQGVRGYNDPRAISLPNKNKVWLQSDKEGQTFAPFHLDIRNTKATWMHSLPHSWADQVDARNNGNYDQWLAAKHSGHPEYSKMPLTMGYHTREDIPFYYALADAFTICDQHFCSSLTGTTPNRLYFWTGTIREKQNEPGKANVWNDDTDYDVWANWTSFPERLEDQGVSWKIYQNEISVGVGFEGEEDAWLANFTDNPIEFFSQFNVKLSSQYIDNLPRVAARIREEIQKREESLSKLAPDSHEAKKMTYEKEQLNKYLRINEHDQQFYTKEKYDRLTAREKSLHEKAFTTNRRDPAYHELTSFNYRDGNEEREMKIPKGDILHQFREDVKNNQLPLVSWIVSPENFSDHPSSAWYGAWYISEVMDILTSNPEIWKKTIFVLSYDENDGYFDHVPPFVAPYLPGSGLASTGLDTRTEFVHKSEQSSGPEHQREHSIGLGYRVPLVIASPWSRGGWVNSEVFDHTSSLQFLEQFLSRKTGKKIEEPNISSWRRCICGDLTSVFRPWNGEEIKLPPFIQRDPFLEGIHKAQFRQLPSNYRALAPEEIRQVNENPLSSPYFPLQEKGIRSASAIPYELYAEGRISSDRKHVEISFTAGNKVFGSGSAGAPFQVYARGNSREQASGSRAYGVSAGDSVKDEWLLSDFAQGQYHLQIYGPNGFFREFRGDEKDPALDIQCHYHQKKGAAGKLTGHIELRFASGMKEPLLVEVKDLAYQSGMHSLKLSPGRSETLVIDLSRSMNWYDVAVTVKGRGQFEKRYAGHVETGEGSKTDPLMGQVI